MDRERQTLYERLLTGLPAAAGSAPVRPSAAIVPWRRATGGGVEVYWVRRSPSMRFMGGWYAFPGGGLARSDAELALADSPAGCSESTFSPAEPEGDVSRRQQLGPDLLPGLAACAIRELFEETGLLLVAEEELAGTERPAPEVLAAARRRLLDKRGALADLVSEHGWALSAGPLVFAGRWLTPPLSPLRFDNRFFLLRWPRDRVPQPSLMGSELDRGEWIRPAEALARWRRGDVLVAPPILHILRVLSDAAPETGLERLRHPDEANLGPLRRIEFRPGVILLPLLTPTLPPATHTNAYLLGQRRVVLVDPATPHRDETDRLRRAVAAAPSQDLRITAIWLTHHHADHVGAVEAMRRDLGVPVCAHRLTAERLQHHGLAVDEELRDGQVFDLGGDREFPVRVVHTPGHTRGHLCFFDETHRSLLAGDLASTLSTIVIDPPEGDMDAYVASLDRVIALRPRLLFPAHGPAVSPAVPTLEKLKRHRLEREEQVLATWRGGTREPAAMVKAIYADVPREIHPVAERQLHAHLDRLRRHGRLRHSGEDSAGR